MNASRYPCPCCGYLVFRMQPGGSERCPIRYYWRETYWRRLAS